MTSYLLGDTAVRVVTLPRQHIDLAYREAGHGGPLLLIMGLGADSAAWNQHVQAWASAFRCIAVDNRGAGRSSAPPGPYSTAMLADDYAELIAELRLGQVPVVGISMGGAIAQELALRHPGLVSRLVLVSTWARLDSYATQIFQNLAAVRAQADRAAFTQLLQLWIWGPAGFEQRAAELTAERYAARPAMAQHAFAAQATACTGHDTVGRLGQIRVPTLITAGSRDIFTPLRFARQIAGSIPGARLEVFDDAAHAHHWERLQDFNALVKEWLQ